MRPGLPLIGRETELGMLDQLLTDVARGQPRVAVVSGEPGIGKSTLVDTFLGRVGVGVHWARGGCTETPQPVPFAPFAEALRPALRRSAEIDQRLVPYLQMITDPETRTAEGSVPSRTRMFEAVLDFFADADAPTVLTLDDIQWADASSLDLLTFLVRNLRTEPLLLVVVCRDRRSDAVADVLEEIRRTVHPVQIQLVALGTEALAVAFEGARGTAPTADELRRLESVTGGNAFFVEQVLLSSRRSGSLPTAAATLLRRELETLGAEGTAVVELLAVAGEPLPRDVLGEALGEERAQSGVGQGLAANVVRPAGTDVEIRHSLFRAAIMDRILGDRRRELHAALATAGERLADAARPTLSPGAVAEHWVAAGDVERSIPALARAARSAEAMLAFAEASVLWETLLDHLDRGGAGEAPDLRHRPLLFEALREAAATARWLGRPQRAVELMSRALILTTPEDRQLRVLLHGRRGHYRRLTGDLDAARWDADHSVALLDDSDPPLLRASVVSEQARLVVLGGDAAAGLASAERAAWLTKDVPDAALRGRVMSTLGVAQANMGQFKAAIASLRDGQHLASTYGDFEDTIRATNNLAYALLGAGRLQEGLAAATEAIELARRVGVERHAGAPAVAQDNAVYALLGLGRWTEARARLDEHLSWRNTDLHRGWLLGTRAQLFASTGAFADSHRDLAELDTLRLPDRAVGVGHAAAAAELACWEHRPEDAARVVQAQLDDRSPVLDWALLLPWGLRGLGDLAAIARLRRDETTLTDLAERAHEMVEHVKSTARSVGLPPVARALVRAELVRVESGQAAEVWDEVVAVAADWPYERAYAAYRSAEALLGSAHPERDAAARLIAVAHRIAVELGAQPLREAVISVALRADVAIRTDPVLEAPAERYSALRLTGREREVLEYLRQGMTNRKIGRAMQITEKTASVHVSNILGKLGVANRTAAAAVAYQLGL